MIQRIGDSICASILVDRNDHPRIVLAKAQTVNPIVTDGELSTSVLQGA
jgi:hypothetical protein